MLILYNLENKKDNKRFLTNNNKNNKDENKSKKSKMNVILNNYYNKIFNYSIFSY